MSAADPLELLSWLGFGNLVSVARAVAVAALQRAESRGAHRRRDYPEGGGQNYPYWIVIARHAGELEATIAGVPVPSEPP